jgi:hypothetical protein
MKHIDDALMAAYVANDVPLLRRMLCAWHLKRCPDCASRHVKAIAGEKLLGVLRKAIDEERECKPPKDCEVTEASIVETLGKPNNRTDDSNGIHGGK